MKNAFKVLKMDFAPDILSVPKGAVCVVAATMNDDGLNGTYEAFNLCEEPLIEPKIFNITSSYEFPLKDAYSLDALMRMGEEYAQASLQFNFWMKFREQSSTDFLRFQRPSLHEMTSADFARPLSDLALENEIKKIKQATESEDLKAYLDAVRSFKYFVQPDTFAQ
jgi:hypothetical protein